METDANIVSQMNTGVNISDALGIIFADIMDTMGADFVDWLIHELETRGWSYRELGRRAELSPSAVSKVIGRERNPGFDFCVSIAGPLEMMPEEVLRKAGLLPALPDIDEDATIAETIEVMRRLKPEEREEVLAYAIFRYQQQRGG